jgi:hypothetical protein
MEVGHPPEVTIQGITASGSSFDVSNDSEGNYFSKTRLKLRFLGDIGP